MAKETTQPELLNALSELEAAIMGRVRHRTVDVDAVAQMIVHVQYLQFDLEATRRERDNLQRILEEQCDE